jgi:hypothetical protein
LIEDADLFLALAEIAGVFVGFGALIGVTRRSEIGATQLGQIKWVVTSGLLVIVAALLPVVLVRYGVTGHNLWSVCSLVVLLLIWFLFVFALRKVEAREQLMAWARANPMATVFLWLVLELPIQVPLVLTVLGLYPDLEAVFYTTALVFNLFEAAFVLGRLVVFPVDAPSS